MYDLDISGHSIHTILLPLRGIIAPQTLAKYARSLPTSELINLTTDTRTEKNTISLQSIT